jgi:hypothetical protein
MESTDYVNNLIRHIISACPILENKHTYIQTHDSVCVCGAQLQHTQGETKVKLGNIHWYKHVPK